MKSRLDNIVYKMGFSASRTQARQLVRHNHFLVTGKKVNIPSYLVKVGDVIEAKEKSREVSQIIEAMETVVRRGVPGWMEVEKEAFKGTMTEASQPRRSDDADSGTADCGIVL